jgi:serine/threonine-protein kinase
VFLGGDPEAVDAVARQEVFVPDFAVAEFPITTAEYCDYLNDLEKRDPGEALRRAPNDVSGTNAAWVERDDGGVWVPHHLLIEGDAREHYPRETFGAIPVASINWFDAQHYCRWRSERDGETIRLPTEAEWEKAARGADGRFYPWGEHFDPTFCLMRDSRQYVRQVEPVGTCPKDVSPYGVRDMAGGFREWMGDRFGERSPAELAQEPEPVEGTTRSESTPRIIRGGCWHATSEWSRCASRSTMYALMRGMALTFRVAKTLHHK